MIHTPLAVYLALNKIEGLGIKSIAFFEKNYRDITQLLALNDTDLIQLNWKDKQIQQWRQSPWKIIEQELQWAEQPDCHILHWHHPAYSRLLKEIHRPPVILYVKGQLDALNRQSLAIVGTRHPTHYGQKNAADFSQQLAEIGFCITSGLAIGIDGIAHHAALPYPTGTIAVVATGLDQVYPVRHTNLAQKILENGAVISEFSFKTPPRPENFPRRNRIISGLSRGVLVIEAALKSGSLITARYAMEQDREVFAIPGIIQNPKAQGCHTLMQQGAVLVNSVEKILEELNMLSIPENNLQKEENVTIPSTISSSPLLQHIDYAIPVSIDILVERMGLSADNITIQLLELELSGVIQKAEGGYFRC